MNSISLRAVSVTQFEVILLCQFLFKKERYFIVMLIFNEDSSKRGSDLRY